LASSQYFPSAHTTGRPAEEDAGHAREALGAREASDSEEIVCKTITKALASYNSGVSGSYTRRDRARQHPQPSRRRLSSRQPNAARDSSPKAPSPKRDSGEIIGAEAGILPMIQSLCAESDMPERRAACAEEVGLLREVHSTQSLPLRLSLWFSQDDFALRCRVQRRETHSVVRNECGTSFRPVHCSLSWDL
jgi:hypothetical protein